MKIEDKTRDGIMPAGDVPKGAVFGDHGRFLMAVEPESVNAGTGVRMVVDIETGELRGIGEDEVVEVLDAKVVIS